MKTPISVAVNKPATLGFFYSLDGIRKIRATKPDRHSIPVPFDYTVTTDWFYARGKVFQRDELRHAAHINSRTI